MTPQQSDALQRLIHYFKVMGNADRLRIAVQLMHAPAAISELAVTLDLKRPAVAEHIAELFELACRKAGLNSRRPILSAKAFRRPGPTQLGLF